jgi:CheY-like chemotaxis protein
MSMDLSDAVRTAAAVRSAPPAWRQDAGALAGRLGLEVAAPLSAALERVLALSASGTIDRHGLNALREEIERARRVGIMGQQLGRLATGQVQQQPEPLDLAQMLCQAVQQHSAETGVRDIGIRQLRRPAIVSADAALLYALLQTLLDWCFEHSRSRIEFHVELRHWPVQARLLCSFAWREPDAVDTAAAAAEPQDPCRPEEPGAGLTPGRTPEAAARTDASEPRAAGPLDSVAWQLLQRMATLLGVQLERESSDWQTLLEIVFPAELTAREPTLTEADAQAATPPPLPPGVAAGSRVLVLVERRELRHVVRESLRRLALTVDFVASSEEARDWCSESPPQALVYEAGLAGAEPLRRRLQAGPTPPAFVRVAAEGDVCEVAQRAEQTTTVGREAVMDLLPTALLNELARVSGSSEHGPAQ